MAIDKSIQYVEQDGYNNYIKNSDSVTVPRNFKSRANATPTSLAYITKDEAKMLKKMKKNTPHKGPSGVPSYDDFDAQGNYRSGAAMSAAETGGKTERDRADLRAAGIGPAEAQDLRSSAIAAGAGQRVNPGFFDSRNTVSPIDLQLAKQFNPSAFKKVRGSGLLNFIRSGGIMGNLVRSLGQRLGFGKTYDQPTYDMSQFNDLGLLTNRINPTYYDDLGNEGILSTEESKNILKDLGNPKGDDRIVPEELGLEGDGSFKVSSSPLSDTELNNRINIANQFGLPLDYSAIDLQAAAKRAMTQPGINVQLEKNDPNVPDEIEFLGGQKATLTPYDPYSVDLSLPSNNLRAEVSQADIDAKKEIRGFEDMDYDTYKSIMDFKGGTKITPFEFKGLQEGTITEPGRYTT